MQNFVRFVSVSLFSSVWIFPDFEISRKKDTKMKLEGHLEKRSDWTRSWQKRYFVYGAGELKYYIDKSDAKPKGIIRIGKCSLGRFFTRFSLRSPIITNTKSHTKQQENQI